jgi:hypothetical protein
MKKSRGMIPKKILMFRKDLVADAVTGIPAYPVRKGGTETAMRNAKSWARRSGYVRRDPTEPVEFDNLPRDGYRIVGAEQRGEGGRAWKVVSPDGDLVDMREDVFLPILLSRGLPRGGVIPASFQWCQNGSQLRLEEVGSDQHKQYRPEEDQKEATEEAAKARKQRARKQRAQRLGVRDLVVGHVYEFRQHGHNFLLVFLGRARYQGKIKTAWVPDKNFRQLRKTRGGAGELRTGSQALRDCGPVQGFDFFIQDLDDYRTEIHSWFNGSGDALQKTPKFGDRKAPLDLEWL